MPPHEGERTYGDERLYGGEQLYRDEWEYGDQRLPGDADVPAYGDQGSPGDGDASAYDAKPPGVEPSGPPLFLGVGLATAARCGPELTSPEGVEAQTCVLTQGEDTWARTYYRNAAGRALEAVLSLMGPAGRTVQMRCAVGADDEPASCETPRERTRGDLDGYAAVVEFAGPAGDRSLLLRVASNSQADTGS